MTSVRTYLIGLIILAVAVSVFAVLWLTTYTNYTSLQVNYANLQSQYQTLQSQYNTLESNYTNLETNYSSLQNKYQILQSQYSDLQSNYTILQNRYEVLQPQYISLQDQYQQLQSRYSNLNNTYWNILTFLGYWSGSDTLPANYFAHMWVVIPNGFSGTIYVTISASSPVQVYVLDLSNLILAVEGYLYTYYLYDQGAYINDQVSVGPGLYVITVVNPSSTTISFSYSITTTYTQTS